MSESDGRRIKRSLLIKVSSIRFLEPEEIKKIEQIELLAAFLKERAAEIEAANTSKKVNKNLLINNPFNSTGPTVRNRGQIFRRRYRRTKFPTGTPWVLLWGSG